MGMVWGHPRPRVWKLKQQTWFSWERDCKLQCDALFPEQAFQSSLRMSRKCQAVKTTSNITEEQQKRLRGKSHVKVCASCKKIKIHICPLQPASIFSTLNHPCFSMVNYCLFDVFLSWLANIFRFSSNQRVILYTAKIPWLREVLERPLSSIPLVICWHNTHFSQRTRCEFEVVYRERNAG